MERPDLYEVRILSLSNCHSRESGNPGAAAYEGSLRLDSRLRGNDTAVVIGSSASQLPHHRLAQAVDLALAGERDEAHLAALAGLEADRRAGGNVEAEAARPGAVEFQRRIGLEEMVVRADLDRPVAGIGDLQGQRLAVLVHDDVAGFGEDLAGLELLVRAADRMMHRDELRPVREGRLDL